MKDLLGKKVISGDLIIEETGGDFSTDCDMYSYTIYEVSKMKDGRGIKYDIEGTSTDFYWANPEEGIKLNKNSMPKGFIYSFLHGMHYIHSPISYEDNICDIYKIIEKSDWEDFKIEKQDVLSFKTLANITLKSFSDIWENWENIKTAKRFPNCFVNALFDLFDISKYDSINGEIGISSLHNGITLFKIMRGLRHEESNNRLATFCKMMDENKRG